MSNGIPQVVFRILGVFFLLVAVAEVGAHIALAERPKQNPLWAGAADSYRDAEWADEYFVEFRRTRERWEPYTYWRRAAVQSRFINVDERGIRRTWNQTVEDDANDRTYRIFVFGASPVWGYGSRDDYTIPSYIAKLLAERTDLRIEVVNYAECGHVTTQELITLMREITAGNAPDVAVFYNGISDIASAYLSKRAGLPQNEWRRAREFNLLHEQRFGDLSLEYLRALYRFSGLGRAANLFRSKLLLFAGVDPYAAHRAERNPERLLDEALAVYAANLEFVSIIAEAYGFETRYYFQPIIYYKPSMTDFERYTTTKDYNCRQYESIFALAPERIRQEPRIWNHPRFRDLHSIFETVTEPIFIDCYHMAERGNEIVARAMVDDILDMLQKRAERLQREPESRAKTLRKS